MTNVFMKNIKKIPHSQTGNPLLGVILHTMLQVINFFLLSWSYCSCWQLGSNVIKLGPTYPVGQPGDHQSKT